MGIKNETQGMCFTRRRVNEPYDDWLDNKPIKGGQISMGHIVRIVTHHEDKMGAAEAWARAGVCAIGYIRDRGQAAAGAEDIKEYMIEHGYKEAAIPFYISQFLRFRDEMEEGEIVLAYVGDNIVGLVGEVVSEAFYDDENEVGSNFSYPNQRRVKWWPEPRFFSRRLLPDDIIDWISGRGTIRRMEYDTKKLTKVLQGIATDHYGAFTVPGEDVLEDFIVDNFGTQFPGWDMVGRQYHTDVGHIDVLAFERATKTYIVIELKLGREADPVVGQVLRYVGWVDQNLRKKEERVRGLIICGEQDLRLTYALRTVSNITAKIYRMTFSLEDYPLDRR